MTQAAVLASNASLMTTPSGTAPSFLCRAWVNFDGTGTVAIRGSGNVSSITDNGTGDYTVNFTTAMPDANYAYAPAQLTTGNASWAYGFTTISTTAFRMRTVTNGSVDDFNQVSLAIFR